MSERSHSKFQLRAWRGIYPAILVFGALVMATSAACTETIDLKAAADNYSESCADCHGKSGKGDGLKAAELSTRPANYTDCAAMSKYSDDYLFNVIKNGGRSVGKSKDMADFGKAYDDDEIRGLVAFVRTFCKK